MDHPESVSTRFNKPTLFDRFFNRLFGLVIRIGIGFPDNFLLEVRGRKTGRTYSTPVNIINHDGRRFLVAPRGNTQWVRNVIASGEAVLKRGGTCERVGLTVRADEAKPEILKSYLDQYKFAVQRYFPVPAGSPVEEFQPLTSRYPVFEVTPR